MSRSEIKRRELAVRARIADKLKNYNSSEDTTVSHFTLADEKASSSRESKLAGAKSRDAWGQADPREVGRWNKENRRPRVKSTLAGLR